MDCRSVRRTLRRGACFTIPFLTLCTVSGCVREAVEKDTVSFAFQWWAPFVVFVPSGGAALLGWVMIRQENWRGYAPLIVGIMFLIGCGPGMFTQHVTVDRNHVDINVGVFWMFPTKHDIRFSDVKQIALEEKPRRRGTTRYVVFEMKSGKKVEVAFDRLVEPALKRIFSAAREHGIPVRE